MIYCAWFESRSEAENEVSFLRLHKSSQAVEVFLAGNLGDTLTYFLVSEKHMEDDSVVVKQSCSGFWSFMVKSYSR